MTEIHEGDRVSLEVNELGGRVSGTVIEIYTSAINSQVAKIAVFGWRDFHQDIQFLTLEQSLLHCQHSGCHAITHGKAGASWWCPDHLSEIFGEAGDNPRVPC